MSGPVDALGDHVAVAPFGVRLRTLVNRRGALCVGIDPHAALLASWGLSDDASGLNSFAMAVVEALGDQIALLKPQSAFFERHGSRGIAVLERCVAAAREAGALVLLDAKRGDIGSTMAAYADYLNPTHPLCVDAMTVSPYLGFAALSPAIDAARTHSGGLFVLARTSNPEGGTVQLATSPVAGNGPARSVAQHIVDAIVEINSAAAPDGSIGVVVGATLPVLDVDISALGGPILIPGLGAQGGDATHIRELFAGHPGVLLPSSSRDILRHGPHVASLRTAARRIVDELGGVGPSPGSPA